MSRDPIERLAELHGIGLGYHDYRGAYRQTSTTTQRRLLEAMGLNLKDERGAALAIEQHDTVHWMRMVPPVVTVYVDDPVRVPVSVPEQLGAREATWRVALEDGTESGGTLPLAGLEVIERGQVDGRDFVRVALPLPAGLPVGYHRVSIALDTGLAGSLRLVLAPRRCHEPAVLQEGGRVWGLSVQLYSLRSPRNWGIGDFGDLCRLIELATPLGCAVIGLNPLHALMPANPEHASPYSPSSRQFLNVLYIDVERVPEFRECEPARAHVASSRFQALLAHLRATANVDYARVAAAKSEVLRMVYAHFRRVHLEQGTARALAFRRFVEARGEPLQLHATFDALDAHLRLQGPQYWGWPSWPEEYRDHTSPAVNRFARERVVDVEYFAYLQWLAEEQLHEAQALACALGMSIGLYGDVAVGANPGGSETWANRRLYTHDASIGAPPDALALKGQDWGIPPANPAELVLQEYAPFIVMLRNNMRCVAALRIDHVMALYRLWWVPRGLSATEGAYVHYPLEDLVALVALESQRNRCLVVGEDLGTVPNEVRVAMERHGLYHYKVLLFEQERDGRFRLPSEYVRGALATVTTHDLPTLKGWWTEHDLALRDRLDMYPSKEFKHAAHAARANERRELMHALVRAGLWHWGEHERLPDWSPALARAVQAFLGLSESRIALMQLEDLIGMDDPVNVPGTSDEHPNWQRKIVLDLEEIFARAEVRDVLTAVDRARNGLPVNGS